MIDADWLKAGLGRRALAHGSIIDVRRHFCPRVEEPPLAVVPHGPTHPEILDCPEAIVGVGLRGVRHVHPLGRVMRGEATRHHIDERGQSGVGGEHHCAGGIPDLHPSPAARGGQPGTAVMPHCGVPADVCKAGRRARPFSVWATQCPAGG